MAMVVAPPDGVYDAVADAVGGVFTKAVAKAAEQSADALSGDDFLQPIPLASGAERANCASAFPCHAAKRPAIAGYFYLAVLCGIHPRSDGRHLRAGTARRAADGAHPKTISPE